MCKRTISYLLIFAMLFTAGLALSVPAFASYLEGSVVIKWEQGGSGFPSPDNVRTISGIYCGSAGTVYGGELNIATGVLTVTHGMIDLGSFVWKRHGTYTNCLAGLPWSSATPDKKSTIFDSGASPDDAVCSAYNVVDGYTVQTFDSDAPDFSIAVAPRYWSGTQSVLVIKNMYMSNVELSYQEQMSGVQLVFPLQASYSVDLTEDEVTYVLYQLGYVAGDESIVLRGYLDNVSSWLELIEARLEYANSVFRYVLGFGLAGIVIVLLYFVYRFFGIFF